MKSIPCSPEPFRAQRILLNSLRFLANDLQPHSCVLERLKPKRALMTDQQLADRFEAFELPPWRDDAEFITVLKTLASIMPLHLASDLSESKPSSAFIELDDGVTVRLLSHG